MGMGTKMFGTWDWKLSLVVGIGWEWGRIHGNWNRNIILAHF